jgi:hypothetical protein
MTLTGGKMALSNEQKEKIEEEERYRAKISNDIKKGKKDIGCLGLIGIFLAICVVVAIGNKIKEINTTNSKPEVITEDYKNSLSQTFCNNRSDGKPYYDLQWIVDSINGKTVGDHANYVTKQPLPENCKKVIEFCLQHWSKEDCDNIANKKIWIGMTSLQLTYSWGLPKSINNTTTAFGISTQWVYGGSQYVYLEGKSQTDLKVTSWQN